MASLVSPRSRAATSAAAMAARAVLGGASIAGGEPAQRSFANHTLAYGFSLYAGMRW